MARRFCRIWLKGCALALLLGNAILPGSASAQAPVYITQWRIGPGDGHLSTPLGLAADAAGNVYVLVAEINYRVVVYSSTGAYLSQWDLPDHPYDDQYDSIAADAAGNVYVGGHMFSPGFNWGFVVKYGSGGVGGGGWGPFVPGIPDEGTLYGAFGIAADGSGNVYVTDIHINKFTSTGTYLTRWDSDVCCARGVAVDAAGDVYVTDLANNRIQKFTSTGAYITQWGSPGSGDGQFDSPRGVAADASGNVYVMEHGNHRVQMFTSSGDYIAQWGGFGSGNGQFSYPWGVATDALGNVYVLDRGNSRIQKFGHLPTPAKATSWGQLKRLYR